MSLFKWLPLERIVAKVLTAAIDRIMQSKKTAAQIAQIRKTVNLPLFCVHLKRPYTKRANQPAEPVVFPVVGPRKV